jgi:hypothetical protein
MYIASATGLPLVYPDALSKPGEPAVNIRWVCVDCLCTADTACTVLETVSGAHWCARFVETECREE